MLSQMFDFLLRLSRMLMRMRMISSSMHVDSVHSRVQISFASGFVKNIMLMSPQRRIALLDAQSDVRLSIAPGNECWATSAPIQGFGLSSPAPGTRRERYRASQALGGHRQSPPRATERRRNLLRRHARVFRGLFPPPADLSTGSAPWDYNHVGELVLNKETDNHVLRHFSNDRSRAQSNNGLLVLNKVNPFFTVRMTPTLPRSRNYSSFEISLDCEW